MNAETKDTLFNLSNKLHGIACLFKGFTDEVVLGEGAMQGIGAILEEISTELYQLCDNDKANTNQGNVEGN